VTGLQESVVQTFPSSQLAGGPPLQTPPPQVSPVVQAFPSSQAIVLFEFWHPSTGSQESVVQMFPSLQFGAGPPLQTPAPQVSPVVQASPSLHAAVLLAFTQPVAGTQESVVQILPSLQFGGAPPTQAPPLQVSAVVQAFPSSQAAVLVVFWQPSTGSQVSSVQTLPSSQFSGEPPTQTPLLQVSTVVQVSPSSQAAVLLVFWQPSTGSQVSSVQTLPSLQLGGGPPLQTPPPQVSPVVQASPSSQAAVLFEFWHPSTGSHESVVQTLLSSQF
jgi:hypothetical protein